MLQSLTYTWALNQARPHRPVETRQKFPPSSSARGAQLVERGGCVEGWDGQGVHPPSLPTSQPQAPSVLLIVSRTRLPPSSIFFVYFADTPFDQIANRKMLLQNSILICALWSSGVQAWKNVYILIYCSYLICNLKWNQGNPVGSQAVLREESIIFYRRHLYHPIPQASLKKNKRGKNPPPPVLSSGQVWKKKTEKNRSPPSSGQVCHPTIKANTNVTIKISPYMLLARRIIKTGTQAVTSVDCFAISSHWCSALSPINVRGSSLDFIWGQFLQLASGESWSHTRHVLVTCTCTPAPIFRMSLAA